MKEKTAILKFLEWCDNNPVHELSYEEIIGEARCLASLEAKEIQEGTMKTGLQKLEDILDGQTYWELDELTDLIHDMAKKEREQKPTANADLVGELKKEIALINTTDYPEDFLNGYARAIDDLKEILK